MFEFFNTRELALFLWIGVFFTWILAKKSMRSSISNLIRSIFVKKLSVIYIVIALYTAGMVYSLYLLNLWDSTQIKNTAFWFFTIGIVSVFRVNDKSKENYVKTTINNIFSITVILQFIISVYTFSFFTELLLIPLGVMIIGMIVVGERDPKNKKLTKSLRNLLNYFGLFLIGHAIIRIISDYKSFGNTEVLFDFLTPATLSILFLPVVYFISLYVSQESAFIGLARSSIKTNLLWYARWQTFLSFSFSKTDMQRWRSFVLLREYQTKEGVRNSIEFINHLKKVEKDPPAVSEEAGWSPYKAKDFLAGSGITTGYYHPYFDDEGWSASSRHINVEESRFPDNVSYYVEGDRITVTQLRLVINVFSAGDGLFSIEKFISYCSTLYRMALMKPLPDEIEAAIRRKKNSQIIDENKRILVSVNRWPEHKLDGYNIDLIIGVISNDNTH